MATTRDIVIAGAGIMGLAIAWQLRRRSDVSILVLDKGAGVGEGSTGASSAVCRYRYSMDEMVHLARDGIAAYRQWQDFTGLAAPRAQFNNDGVLWLSGQDRAWADREHLRMQSLGIRSEVFEDDELQRRYPAFSSCTLAPDTATGEDHPCVGGGRHFLEPDGGYIDPVACAEDLLEACRGAGVDVRFNAPVTAIRQHGGRVQGVTLGDGSTVDAGTVINAAGPWCNDLLRGLDLELPWHLTPTRIQIAYLDRPAQVPGHIPVTVDMAAGIYFRQQNRGQQIVLGSVLEEDERERVDDPNHYELFPDQAFLQAKLHALHHRLPGLPYRGKVRGYCGLYTVNQEDMHPLVGESELKGFYLANGFSGHGFKLAPAIGALVAGLLRGPAADFDTRVDPAFFRPDRAPINLGSRSVLA